MDTASNGEQAIKLFNTNPQKYDLIVTDLAMPKLSGIELTEAIKSSGSTIPIIFLSGRLDIKDEKNMEKSVFQLSFKNPGRLRSYSRAFERWTDR